MAVLKMLLITINSAFSRLKIAEYEYSSRKERKAKCKANRKETEYLLPLRPLRNSLRGFA
jgi:hypothetical protein